MSPPQRRALVLIATAQLGALTLWFSATAVAPALQSDWGLDIGQASWLTLAVQLGFVVGGLALAVTGLPDVVGSRRVFAVAGMVGAAANAALVAVDGTLWMALVLRGVTGVALAGVYPSGLKVMAGWFREGRGMALGVLVGALTLGSAVPHLIRGLGLAWQPVVLLASALAVAAVVVMRFVGDGPFDTGSRPFEWGHARSLVHNRGFRLSTYGYLGHMWELYAMWTWVAAYLAASFADRGIVDDAVSVMTFAIIAVGGVGAWSFGRWADRVGRTVVAAVAMVLSGAMAILTTVVFGAPSWLVIGLLLMWGFAVVADSAQFSVLVTETTPDDQRGTALTLQTAVGFLLTLVTIRGVPVVAARWGWRWAFAGLALGPLLGTWAMLRLWSSAPGFSQGVERDAA